MARDDEHYEELGVSPTASAGEIRTSYLELARRFHPDRLSAATAPERAVAAARMSRINVAWSVLGDRERRAAYDRSLHRPTSGATVRDPGSTWVPFEDDDEVDPRLLDDTPSGAPTLRRELTFLPAGLAAVALLVLIVGFVIGLGPLLAVGLILFVCSGVSFLLVPLVALAKSSRADRI